MGGGNGAGGRAEREEGEEGEEGKEEEKEGKGEQDWIDAPLGRQESLRREGRSVLKAQPYLVAG